MKNLFKAVIKPLYHFFKNKNEREFYRLFDSLSKYERFVTVYDVKFLNYIFDVPDAASFIWQFKEIFVEDIYNFKAVNETPIILDCGSNIGTSLIYFSQMYPEARIIGFEADSAIAEISIQNLKKNNITNVDVINSAVWVDNDGINFSTDGADGGSVRNGENSKKVKSIRLKEVLQQEPIIDFLKIDIEGAEYEVMNDCKGSLANVENIFIEYHSWNNSSQGLSSILNILEKNNFRYYIEDISKRKQPFINRGLNSKMDLQLNIFGYKTNK